MKQNWRKEYSIAMLLSKTFINIVVELFYNKIGNQTKSYMNRIVISLILLSLTLSSVAQEMKSFDIDLWQNGLPNSNGIDKTQPYDNEKRNFKPSIRVFLPETSHRDSTAILVIPGGGYRVLSIGQEGYEWAEYFVPQGIPTIVLSYRMPMGFKEVPMSDATEAMRIIRENAKEWGIKPDRIGILGSSAGGHLASTIATHSEEATRPNFQILFYPVISMDKEYTHLDSHNCFVGEEATKEQEDAYSNQLHVNAQTPPAILLLSDDDFLVSPRNSAEYYLALKKANVKASMHVYPSGGHGWGCGKWFKYREQMLKDLQIWLDELYAPKPKFPPFMKKQ